MGKEKGRGGALSLTFAEEGKSSIPFLISDGGIGEKGRKGEERGERSQNLSYSLTPLGKGEDSRLTNERHRQGIMTRSGAGRKGWGGHIFSCIRGKR